MPMQNCRGGRRGGGGEDVGETRATRWALRPPRCGAIQPGPAGAAVSGASGGIGSGHSRHQTPDTLLKPLGEGSGKQAQKPTPSPGVALDRGPALFCPPPAPSPSMATGGRSLEASGRGVASLRSP